MCELSANSHYSHSFNSGNPVVPNDGLIGVGRACCSPSLRTVQADLPHTALQLVVFTWLRIDELHHHRKEIPADKQRNVHCPFLPIRVVNMRNFDRHSVFSLAAEAAPACLARGHWRWLRFCFDRRYASTSLPPLAPSPLRDFTATMEALTPVGPALRSRTGCLNTVSFNRQVSLIHASDRPIIPPPTTLGLPPSLSHPTPQRVGLLTRVSPGFATESQARQLSGRIAFVILRTDRSPPAALHPASRRRSCSRLQAGEGVPEEDFHLSDQMRFQAHDSRFRGNDSKKGRRDLRR